MNFTQCEKAGLYEGFALVKSCDKKSAKNGTFYLDMILGDKDGEIFAKLWDYREEITPLPQANTLVKVRGTLQQYNGNDQFIVQRIRSVTEQDNVNVSDYVKSADCTGDDMLNTILDIVNDFNDNELKAVVLGMIGDNKKALLTFPAAEKLHHAMVGGLLYHTLSIVRLAQCVCDIYPCIDRELLVSGAILHDIAKIREYSVNDAGVIDGHTLEGMLLGHLVMGAEDVGRKCDELNVTSEKKFLLQHMLISHHGQLEFGAAVRPGFIEAEVLSQLDMFDANIYEMADAIKDVEKGGFTNRLWMLDNRRFYNHGRIDVQPQANIIDE
ncbi:MAG: HDIG domain-containing protein [Clostridia bacterium]|nr:HDIG domain-containing protein [Clostridia bacterium]